MTVFHEGFESGKWTHRCRVFPIDGDPYDYETGNIFVPENWVFWFRHDPGILDQPEGHHCWKSGDARRIHSGEGAYQYFSFFRHHDAGLMRQVQVEPGTKVLLTAWAHAWSNHSLESHEGCCDDGRCSCGVDRKITSIPVSGLPEPSGDPWEDAVANSQFSVGIDPTGGMDPFAGTVEWGEAHAIYNGYTIQLRAESVAQGNIITVFLRNITLYNFKHNDAYWDDVELVAVEGEEPPPEKRGDPREQYKRTYVLLPPGAGQEWALAVIDATWNTHRYTLGGSADDAGVGDLDDRRVMAVNPAGWGPGLKEFFAKHYPGILYVPIEAETPEILRQTLSGEEEDIALSQNDPRWANEDLGEDPGGETIGEEGCLLCSLGMCLRRAGRNIYPPELNQILADAGMPFTSDDWLTGWAAAVGLFDEFCDSKKDNLKRSALAYKALLAAGWEIALPRNDYGHYVYLESVENELLNIIDPWDGQRKVKGAGSYIGVRAARRSGTVPSPPPPDFTLRGVHDLAGADWLLANGLEGWCTVARYLGTEPQVLDLKKYAEANIRVVLRLTYSYAQDDGGAGTIPSPDKLAAHEDAVVETMRLNPDAWGFVYGNEPNNKREWPKDFIPLPDYYLGSYNRVWAHKPVGARLSPCAIDPYNPGWGDWRKSWYEVLCKITDCDFLALHAYTHGPDPGLIWHRKEFTHDPLRGVYYDMRVLESQQDIIPSRFWGKPVVVTETNHWVKNDNSVGWEPDAGEWVKETYKYLAGKGVAGACLFRHGYEQWRYGDLPNILAALEALA